MPFHETTLPNGLRVIAELNDAARSVATGFFVKAGSRDESADVAGVSHFLEHMIFKGTPRRDHLAVNRDFDRVGAKHNAQTSEEDTFYHVTCLPEYLPKAFDVLSDILRPSLREDDFDTEKKVIIEEIRMYLDSPMSVAYEAAKAAHFGGHPLGQSILGTVDSITDLPVDEDARLLRSLLQPGEHRARLRGPGRLGPARRAGPGALRGVDRVRLQAARPSRRGDGRVRGDPPRAEDKQQTVIGMADGPPLESDDRYAAQLLATVLGDHTGSRLYWALVDPGLADGAEVGYQDYNQAGVFFTFLSCEPGEAQANLGRVVDAYRNVMTEGITEEELERAKNKVMSRNVLRSERPMGRLTSLGFHWTYRREYLPVEAELDAFARVGPADVRRVLDAYPLLPQTFVSVGPTVDLHPPE